MQFDVWFYLFWNPLVSLKTDFTVVQNTQNVVWIIHVLSSLLRHFWIVWFLYRYKKWLLLACLSLLLINKTTLRNPVLCQVKCISKAPLGFGFWFEVGHTSSANVIFYWFQFAHIVKRMLRCLCPLPSVLSHVRSHVAVLSSNPVYCFHSRAVACDCLLKHSWPEELSLSFSCADLIAAHCLKGCPAENSFFSSLAFA